MSMLAAIKGKATVPINIVNGDVLIVEETQTDDGNSVKVMSDTRVGANTTRPKFKPVDPAVRTALVIEEPERDAPSKHFDLVGDDIGAPPQIGKSGRPRLHPNNAAKQAAYRDRKKANA